MFSRPSTFCLLLVEDNASDVALIESVLEDLALDVQLEVVHDGDEALRRLPLHPCPDLVLMDVNMPKVTGLEVLHALRDCLPPTRVVMWSTAWSPVNVQRARELGAHDYLQKPHSYADLVTLLGTLLEAPEPLMLI